ncbi:MAG: hypothetical protein JNL92_10950, partial [Opitutaceae bacterium]|nr:hypothetical protein [Opitutaceae bacterium]
MKIPTPWLALALAAGATAADLPLPFNEEFDDNRHNWPALGEHDTHAARIEGGKLIYENLSLEASSWRLSTIPLGFRPHDDYEIRARLRLVSGPTARVYGLTMGEDTATATRGDFVLSDQGTFLAQHIRAGGKFDLLVPWTKTAALKPGEFNELTIQRLAGRTFYSINGQPVAATSEAVLPGNRFGPIIPAGSVVEVDYLRVRALDAKEGGPALRAKLEAAVMEHRIASGPPRTDMIETFDNNARGWRGITTGDTWSGVLADGVVRCENKSAGNQLLALEHPVNYLADYDLRVRVRFTSTAIEHYVGLAWARSTTTVVGRIFSISIHGTYQVWGHNADGSMNVAVGWRKTSTIKPAEFNTLRVRKLGNMTYVFINNQILADVTLGELDGGFIGLHVGPHAKAEIDEFRVTYPQLTAEERSAEYRSHAVALETAHRTAALGGRYSVLEAREKAAAAQVAADATLPKVSTDRLSDA